MELVRQYVALRFKSTGSIGKDDVNTFVGRYLAGKSMEKITREEISELRNRPGNVRPLPAEQNIAPTPQNQSVEENASTVYSETDLRIIKELESYSNKLTKKKKLANILLYPALAFMIGCNITVFFSDIDWPFYASFMFLIPLIVLVFWSINLSNRKLDVDISLSEAITDPIFE